MICIFLMFCTLSAKLKYKKIKLNRKVIEIITINLYWNISIYNFFMFWCIINHTGEYIWKNANDEKINEEKGFESNWMNTIISYWKLWIIKKITKVEISLIKKKQINPVQHTVLLSFENAPHLKINLKILYSKFCKVKCKVFNILNKFFSFIQNKIELNPPPFVLLKKILKKKLLFFFL